ncbi:hypothetical protein EMIT0373P_30818 [Pseudomonas chlororaphis]
MIYTSSGHPFDGDLPRNTVYCKNHKFIYGTSHMAIIMFYWIPALPFRIRKAN